MNNSLDPNTADEGPPDATEAAARRDGTQSLQRALSLLRQVAKYGDTGIRLSQLVLATGLDRGTAYRLLNCMVREQFVDRDDQHLYRLGPQSILLGSTMTAPTPLLTRFVPAMKRIARISGDTVFLMMRRGDLVYCAHREESPSLVKILTTTVGQQRLLGTGTGGAAVLGLIDDEELRQIHSRNHESYRDHRISVEDLLGAAHKVKRAEGIAITYDAVEIGVAGMGAAFRMAEHGMGAISIATLTARFGKERQLQMRDMFLRELQELDLR